jgi:hypothetical protein
VKPLVAIGLLVVGAVTGVATVALHDLGWGLALGIAATVLTAIALPPGWWSRLAFAVGWAALVGWLTVPRPEGDYVISQDLPGYVVLGLGVLLLVLGVATLPRPRRPT